MNDKYIKLQIESIVNKILYKKNVIEKNTYERMAVRLDKLLFEENKNNLVEPWL